VPLPGLVSWEVGIPSSAPKPVVQGCQTYSPRAKTGQLRGWIRPARWFCKVKPSLFAWEVYPVILRQLVTRFQFLETRPITRGGEVPHKKIPTHLGKICWTQFKNIGHSSKNLGPSRKTLRPSWCPKLVTGLLETLTQLFIFYCFSHVKISRFLHISVCIFTPVWTFKQVWTCKNSATLDKL